jgi:selenocysteine lyase/cysteine desulfurase
MTRPSWTRRRFVGMASAVAASTASAAGIAEAAYRNASGALRRAPRSPQSDDDWRDVLAAFDLGDRVTMNTANLAPASAPSRAVLAELSAAVDADPSFQNRARFGELLQDTRRTVAAYLGADPEEIVLTRNTTEGNNFVVQGVDLEAGDEVLLTEHNHPSNRQAWHVRAQREGFTVREVPVPSPPPDAPYLMDSLVDAVTDRTRMIAYSHVTNLGGCRYPAAEINAWARQRGILTLVDGAQTCGAIDVDLHALGCDFYAASGHKWPCAPREVGVLYVRAGSEQQLWPSVVSVGFDEARAVGKMESLGQRDDAVLAAFGHAVKFLQDIGSRAVEARVAALTGLFKQRLQEMPRVTLYTPMDAALSGGVVTFHLDGIDARAAYDWLYRERQIVAASSGVEQGGVRFSPHIYTSVAGCERALEAVDELVSGRVVLS